MFLKSQTPVPGYPIYNRAHDPETPAAANCKMPCGEGQGSEEGLLEPFAQPTAYNRVESLTFDE